MDIEIKEKKFLIVPRDAMELLDRREASFDAALEKAKDYCADTGMAHYVVELKAVASRADKPVKVTKL